MQLLYAQNRAPAYLRAWHGDAMPGRRPGRGIRNNGAQNNGSAQPAKQRSASRGTSGLAARRGTFRIINGIIRQDYQEEGNTHDKRNQQQRRDQQQIDASGKDIASLKGIEYFANLTELNAGHNQLTELDVSRNTQLTHLDANSNNLQEIDLCNNQEGEERLAINSYRGVPRLQRIWPQMHSTCADLISSAREFYD